MDDSTGHGVFFTAGDQYQSALYADQAAGSNTYFYAGVHEVDEAYYSAQHHGKVIDFTYGNLNNAPGACDEGRRASVWDLV